MVTDVQLSLKQETVLRSVIHFEMRESLPDVTPELTWAQSSSLTEHVQKIIVGVTLVT